MLLIGSRAARFHYPEFRKPKDYDFIATRTQTEDFLKCHKHLINSSHKKKIRAKVRVGSEISQFEFDLVESSESNRLIYQKDINFGTYDKKLDISYGVASPETLFLLKKSHIIFPIHWEKNIVDYLFLKEKLFPTSINSELNMTELDHNLCSMRRAEIKARNRSRSRNFDIDNSEFFKKSERFVNRKVDHDSIHYATCFYNKPLFLSVKEDLSKAVLSETLVNKLSFDDKIKLIQEEVMALSLERFIIPAMVNNKSFHAEAAFAKTAGKMIYNYLPDFLKDFAADNFDKVITLSKDYVTEFVLKHKTFRLELLK